MVCRTGLENDPQERMRHSCAHVMADAVQRLFPEAKVAIGPVIENGFYYDFDFSRGFTPDDLKRIEKKMKQIIKEKLCFEEIEIGRSQAIEFFQEKNEPYKIEIIEGLPVNEKLTLYKHGDFTDLCKGPHVETTRDIKAFKLLRTSGAYWRGDEKNKMLQRIYGTAFSSKEQLKQHLDALKEAQKRDHRKLGKELGLFSINENVGPGLILWHPKGGMLRSLIEDYLKKALLKWGYQLVVTPHIGRSTLWETSGHLEFFTENMYPAMEIEGQAYYAKPMNCPFHIQIYQSDLHSYKELPIRFAEFGTVYRYERSGVLHGTQRVRGFTQDDAHIFCTPDQVEDEILGCLKFTLELLKDFGLKEFQICLSTKPEKAVGSDADWEKATAALKKAIDTLGFDYELDVGGGAFYGPKIDVKIKDAIGRYWQCSTIQFDFNLPERFEMSFTNQKGEKERPFMVHRALLGSFERFLGVLIEHYAGAFPVWLAPTQVICLTINASQANFARSLMERLEKEGLRASWDGRAESLGYKIRQAVSQKIPYQLIVGDKEVAENKVAIRRLGQGDLGSFDIEEAIDSIKESIQNRT